MNNTIRKIAIAGVLSAVVIVLGLTGLGFIVLPFGASITILQVPVIIGAVLEGPLVGLFIGLLFGVFSVIQSALIAATPIDMAFLSYPFIAIVPRVLIGPAAWLLYALISGTLNTKRVALAGQDKSGAVNKGRVLIELIAIGAAALVGSLVNTLLVLLSLGFLKVFTWELIIPVIITNGSLEAAGSMIIALVVIPLWKQVPLNGTSRLTREME